VWPTVLYIEQGLVRASIFQEEREKLVAIYGAGMLIPYAAPETVPISHRVQFSAETPVTGWELPYEAYHKLLEKDPALNKQVMTSMWQLIHLLLHEVQSISFDTGLERVASFLYTYFENTGHDRLKIAMSDLQGYIGLNRSNLNKYLSVLIREKVIQKKREDIHILSPTKLRTYCSPRIIECSLVSIAETKLGQLDNQEKWQVVCSRDASYDGTFWYGVKSTGCYCNPSCSSPIPNREDVVFFSEIEDAEAAGFHPCPICRPDLKTCSPNRELIIEFKDNLDRHYTEPNVLKEAQEKIPMTARHINRLFVQYFGQTPAAYIRSRRLDAAAKLLIETDEKVLDLALKAGFNSTSGFYSAFKEAYGVSPMQYRIIQR